MAPRRLPELHIEGYKEMSIVKGPIEFTNPKSVFLPLAFPGVMTLKKEIGDTVKLGEVVMESTGRFPYPVLSPVSGVIKGKCKKWHPSNKMMDMLEIENDFKDETVDTFKGLNPDEMSRQELIEVMRNAGLVGMGGAGFPAWAKYITDKPVQDVLINLAECEPFITCDYTSVLYNATLFVYGFRYLMKAAGCNHGMIAIKKKKMNEKLISMLEPLLDDNMEIKYLRDVYPAGWERYTVETTTGRTYNVLPIEAGVIVSNATTCLSFAKTLKEGIPPVEKYVTITGSGIVQPGNVLVRTGTPITDIVPLFGGLKEGADPETTQIIAGGPMTGKSMYFMDFVTTPTLGAVIVKENKFEKVKQPSCLGCGRCSEGCPSFLTPVEINKALKVGDIEELKALGAAKCIQCGLCSFVCPSRIDLTAQVGKAKDLVRKLGAK